MKKIVFALIAVLLLCSVVACNGDADFLLWEDSSESEDNSRTLKLRLVYTELRPCSFADGDRQALEKSFTVPDSVTTWADLVNENFSFDIYSFEEGYEEDNPHQMNCQVVDYFDPNQIQFEAPTASLGLTVHKGNEPVHPEDAIDFSIVYDIGVQY